MIGVRMAAVAGVLLLAVSGCGGSSKKSPSASGHPSAQGTETDSQAPAIASQPMAQKDGPARVDLLSVDRSANNSVTVRWRVVNLGTKQMDLSRIMGRDNGKFTAQPVADGVSLVDATGEKRYFPYYNTSEQCLCSQTGDAKPQPGKSAEFYAVLAAPPASVQQTAVTIPLTPVFQGIPIGTKPRAVSGAEIDPAKGSLKPADIVPLISTVEGTDQATDDSGSTRSVRLATDVLFAINKSELTPAAQAVLKQVAQQIDASSGSTVKIDGYTDTTGNDSINNPLSVARAQAVQKQLQSLVTRQGITYQSNGHGSADPIADNGTDVGRRKNRRVTVTFARPTPPAAAPTAAATPTPTWTGGKLPVVATATAQDPKLKDVKLEINSLHRDTTGLTTMTWTLTNNGSGRFSVAFTFVAPGQLGTYDGVTVSGATLVDSAAKLQYLTLRDETKGCICTRLNSGKGDLEAGDSVTYFDSYELPSSLSGVDISFPGFTKVTNVQVQ